MGKMRPKILGTEDEAKQKEKGNVRREQKRLKERAASKAVVVTAPEVTATVSPAISTSLTTLKPPASSAGRPTPPKPPKSPRSAAYRRVKALVDKTKLLPVDEALALLPKIHLARFNETVELILNVVDKNVKATLTLPHLAGKKARVATFSEKRAAVDGKEIAAGDFLKNVEEGKIDFAVLLASPAVVPSLAKFAKVLGPRGLMPNPKAGTICPNPEKEAEKFFAGQMTLKPVSENLVIQIVVGKLSSPAKEIEENIAAVFTALGPAKISSAFLKSTMSPAVKLKVEKISS